MVHLETLLGRLSGKRILFGHQSVGADIVRGMVELREDCPGTPFRIFESRDPETLSNRGFCHCRIGKNADPGSKFSDFGRLMDAGFGKFTDIACLKLCYVDITAGTDIESVFRSYKESVIRLKRKYPGVAFLHVTVPVVRESGNPSGILRKIIGKGDGGKEDNAARGRFNELLHNEFGGFGAVFDLASFESGIVHGGSDAPSPQRRFAGPLSPSYTDDGFHLNAKGRKAAAEVLVADLSRLIR